MSNIASQNPWQKLEPPYILPEDLAVIACHRNYSNLRLDALPSQFIGGLDKAEVVFLLLNPGFNEKDVTVDPNLPQFVKANRRNHTDPYGSPFYYFDGGFEQTAGYEWWSMKLAPLLKAGATESILRDKIMVIEYFPYHSKDWKSLPRIPSQQFAFDLAREAMKRNKIIIVRSLSRWLKAVPELANYPHMTFRSSMNVIVSPGNLGEENFSAILSKLR